LAVGLIPLTCHQHHTTTHNRHKEGNKAMNLEALEKAVSRRKWTIADDQLLTDKATLGAKELATILDRPETQIRARATKLGVSLRRDGENRGRKTKVTV
jgi:hypothetical protein